MSASDIYNSGYSFARERDEKKKKVLLLVSVLFAFVILVFLAYGFISSLSFFQGTTEKVTKALPNADDITAVELANKEKTEKYTNAGIPYKDPQNRYEIRFMTPYASDSVVIVFKSEKDYDVSKAEAEKIIANAKQKVEIKSITYKTMY